MSWQGINNGKKINKKYIKIIITVVILIITFIGGNVVARFGLFIGPNSGKYTKSVLNADVVSEYSGLFEAREVLMRNYNGDINDSTLVQGAIYGLTASLKDPYTLYMNAKEYEKYLLSNEGIHVGIGITVTLQNKELVVINVEEGGPAEKAGIKVGDTILKINGEDINGDLAKAASLLQREVGTEFTLNIRNISNEISDIKVFSEEIKIDAVESKMVDKSIGYIRLKNFNEGASDSFIEALTQLEDEGMKGLIIDLRNNPGGFLTEAEKIGSQFIPEGEVITTLKDKNDNKKDSISTGGIAEDMPVVLLINGSTASASEVITGAFRDYDIATTVGTTTYGKGVAQGTYNMKNTEGAIKITIQKFYTPNGENIHKIGISPDYKVELTDSDKIFEFSKDPQYQKALEVIKEKTR